MPKFTIRIDHLDDDQLAFFGWMKAADDEEFSLYARPYDGERQVVAKKPPRYLVVDDYNDAVSMSLTKIIHGPNV